MKALPLQGPSNAPGAAQWQDFRGGVRLDELGKGWKAAIGNNAAMASSVTQKRAVPAHCYAASPDTAARE
jgi:hypothetical protein